MHSHQMIGGAQRRLPCADCKTSASAMRVPGRRGTWAAAVIASLSTLISRRRNMNLINVYVHISPAARHAGKTRARLSRVSMT
jgi:hypothetical protein